MKRFVITMALIASATFAYGQGTIAFLNGPTAVFRMAGTTVAVPTAVNSQLTYGIFVGATADSLSATPAGPTATGSTTAAGRMTGVPALYALEGHAPGTVLFAQVRAWESRFGADWAAAKAQGQYYGETDVRQLEPLASASGPGTVIWQSSNVSPNRFLPMQIVPEPSTIALAILGLGSLLLFRRKK
jgi:hypothetical protein